MLVMKNKLIVIEEKIEKSMAIFIREIMENDDFGPFKLNKPGNIEFGDYTTSAAMEVFAFLGESLKLKYKNPRILASALMEHLERAITLKDLVEKIEVAGPGFVNIWLKNKVWVDLFKNDFYQVGFGKTESRTYVVEYSSPNIAKPFTIGHLRSTIIGATLANLLESIGARVIRDNHLGDWGTQFGKQIVAIEKWGNLDEVGKSQNPIKDLVALYIKFHREAEKNEELNDEARLVFKKMEDGDEKYLSMWQKIIDLSMKEFDKIYDKLCVQFSENEGKGYGESFVRDKTELVVKQLKEKKLLKRSREAMIVEYSEEEKLAPLMILKKDGSSLYATRDLAMDWWRKEKHGENIKIINEVGKEQSLYFKQLYRLEELLGWFKKEQRVHVAHGLYRFKDRKMSTRKGDVVWLEDIWSQAEEKVRAISKIELSDEDVNIIVNGAIKWNDLVREAVNDIDFDLEVMLSLKGNSGSYMQYTGVRIQSIIKKSDFAVYGESDLSKISKKLIDLKVWAQLKTLELNSEQMKLVKKVMQYGEVKRRATKILKTNILASYLFELAQDFNNFYNKSEILNNESNLVITKVIGIVLSDGLNILGIKIPSKM